MPNCRFKNVFGKRCGERHYERGAYCPYHIGYIKLTKSRLLAHKCLYNASGYYDTFSCDKWTTGEPLCIECIDYISTYKHINQQSYYEQNPAFYQKSVKPKKETSELVSTKAVELFGSIEPNFDKVAIYQEYKYCEESIKQHEEKIAELSKKQFQLLNLMK